MKRAFATLAFCMMGGAATADCPTTFADAAQGVYIGFDGYVVRYSRFPDGTVEELELHGGDASDFRVVSHLGVFIHESAEMINGVLQPESNEVITYAQPLPPQLSANMTFATTSTVAYANDAPFQEPLEITVGAPATEQIGDCTMASLPVQMRTGFGQEQFVSNFIYFPALGFATFIVGHGVNVVPDAFPPTYIGTEPPSVTPQAPAAPAAPQAPASK